jgi:hypothetical protein
LIIVLSLMTGSGDHGGWGRPQPASLTCRKQKPYKSFHIYICVNKITTEIHVSQIDAGKNERQHGVADTMY